MGKESGAPEARRLGPRHSGRRRQGKKQSPVARSHNPEGLAEEKHHQQHIEVGEGQTTQGLENPTGVEHLWCGQRGPEKGGRQGPDSPLLFHGCTPHTPKDQ